MSVVERLNLHYQYAKEKIGEDRIIGIFLVGSQNYGTSLETSDVDTKLLIVPSLDDIYKNKKGESSTFILPDGSNEQISIKDIRVALSELKKQNINILEILYTDYKIINSGYKDIWNELEHYKEDIVKYDKITAVKTIKGMVLNTYNRLYTPEGDINCKQVANLVRYEYYLKNYINNIPYIQCLKPQGDDLTYIMQIRNHELGANTLQCIADHSIETIKILIDAYIKKIDIEEPNDEIEVLLNDCCKDFIDTALIRQLSMKGVL